MLSSLGYSPNVYKTYISLTSYINKFQNVKSKGRFVRSVIQLSFATGGFWEIS